MIAQHIIDGENKNVEETRYELFDEFVMKTDI